MIKIIKTNTLNPFDKAFLSPVSDSFVKTEFGTDIPSFVKNAIK